jgi:Ni/Fe-hydrogenase b-type cytochrome subunit
MLPLVNIWLDVAGWVILALLVAALFGAHLSGNIIMGRVSERFIRKKWWYLDALHEPLPKEYVNIILQRTWHWVNLMCFIGFFATGIYIRYPFIYEGARPLISRMHILLAYINIINFSIRIIWTLSTKDRKNFTFDRSDIDTLIKNVKYYIFLRKDYPHTKKFHPVQRATYVSMVVLFIPQILTGLVLLWPQIFGIFLSPIFGGLASAVAWSRIVHTFIFRVFLYIVIAHAYLAILETWPTLKYLWFGIVPQQTIHIGEHHHEAEPSVGEVPYSTSEDVTVH